MIALRVPVNALRVWWVHCVLADSDGSARRNLAYFFLSLCLTIGLIWMACHTHPIMGEISLDLDQNYIGVFYGFHF